MTKTNSVSAPTAIKSIYADIRKHTDIPSADAIDMSARLVALFNQTTKNAIERKDRPAENRSIRYVDDSEIIVNIPKRPVHELALDHAFADGGWAVWADEKELMRNFYAYN